MASLWRGVCSLICWEKNKGQGMPASCLPLSLEKLCGTSTCVLVSLLAQLSEAEVVVFRLLSSAQDS